MTQEEQRAMEALKQENADLRQKLESALKRIAELEAKLNMNSANSSKPPSTDGMKKPNRNRSLRKKTGRKPGGQKGHKGSGLAMPVKADETKDCLPQDCLACPNRGACQFKVVDRHFVFDVKIQKHVTEYRQLECSCPNKGNEYIKGEFPKEAKATKQYGFVVKTLALTLTTECAVSIDRTHKFLKSLTGFPISTGWVQSVVSQCKGQLHDFKKKLRGMVRKAPVLNFDETWERMNGETRYVHNASTDKLTYQTVSKKRGREGMLEGGVLQFFRGIAVHDRWSPYWLFSQIAEHGVCCAHLLREAKGLLEGNPQKWFFRIFIFMLMEMKKKKERRQRQGKEEATSKSLKEYDNMYDNLIELGRLEYPIEDNPHKKGRPALGKARAFIESMAKHKAEVCLFFTNFTVPFDNNQAERDLRHIKVKQKVSGCFRTDEGAENFASIHSFISTAKKMGHNVMEAFKLMLLGCPELVLAPAYEGGTE